MLKEYRAMDPFLHNEHKMKQARALAIIVAIFVACTWVFNFVFPINVQLLIIKYQGSCPTGCPEDYLPVCGTDGVTYCSRCVLDALNCAEGREDVRVAFDGRCGKNDNVVVKHEGLCRAIDPPL